MSTKKLSVVSLFLVFGVLVPPPEPAWSDAPATVPASFNGSVLDVESAGFPMVETNFDSAGPASAQTHELKETVVRQASGVPPTCPEPPGVNDCAALLATDCLGAADEQCRPTAVQLVGAQFVATTCDCIAPGDKCGPIEIVMSGDGVRCPGGCPAPNPLGDCFLHANGDSLDRADALVTDPDIPAGATLTCVCIDPPQLCNTEPICEPLADTHCQSDDPMQNCRPLCVEMAVDGAGVLAPVATECSCISPDDFSCGPLQVLPFGGTPFFDLVCQATCLAPETGSCQVIIDGVATGQGKISSEFVPEGSQVCCDCIGFPPPECPEPAGQTICAGLADEQCLSSDPAICEPLCVTIEGVGGVFTPVAKFCDCIDDDSCGPIDITPINTPPSDYNLRCVGVCDPGENCEVFIDGIPTGLISVNASAVPVDSLVCCHCADDPPPDLCPLSSDLLCEDLQAEDCPEDQAGEFCQASCVDYNNDPVNPIVTASECGCGQEGDCHVVLDAAGQPTCAGTCADGTPCVPTTKDNDDGITLRFCCGCCPSNGLQVDLTTGVDDNTGGFIPIGLDDDTWTVTCEPVAGGTLPRPAKVIAKHPAWALIPGSQWVSATTGGLNGEYCYETCFCLDERARNPVLTLEILADDQATVFVNSFFLGQTPSPGFLVPTIMATTDETFFLSGEINCITVLVENQFGVVTGFDLAGSLTVENGQCCCGPTEDESACEDVDCPVDTEECQPRCLSIDPFTQQVTVDGCECSEEGSCHPEVLPGATTPECVGGCLDGEECIETLIHDPATGAVIGICCDCEPAVGACCVDTDGDGINDDCIQVTADECATQNGTFHGVGTPCVGLGSCCLDLDGAPLFETCRQMDGLCCEELGGQFTAGGVCQGTGACCFDSDGDGTLESCLHMDGLCCDDIGGTFQGVNTVCLGDGNGDGFDDACEPPPPVGACCNGCPAVCTVTTQQDCEQNLSGLYVGDDVPCDPDPCRCSTSCTDCAEQPALDCPGTVVIPSPTGSPANCSSEPDLCALHLPIPAPNPGPPDTIVPIISGAVSPFTGSWVGTDVCPEWQGTFSLSASPGTDLGSCSARPYLGGFCGSATFDFGGMPGSTLPSGSLLRLGDYDRGSARDEFITLQAFGSGGAPITTPWLSLPCAVWGTGSGAGGGPGVLDLPGWSFDPFDGVYQFDGRTVQGVGNPSIGIALHTVQNINTLEVCNNSRFAGFSIQAPCCDCGACCCEDAMGVVHCRETSQQICEEVSSGTYLGDGISCEGDGDGNGIDDACEPPPDFCPLPADQPICAPLQDTQCENTASGLECVPLCVEMAVDGGGALVPVATECSCISPDDFSCGPVHIEPFAGTPFFDFICQAVCPTPAGICQVVIDGLPTGQGKLSSEFVPEGSKVCCDCIEFPPPTCQEPAGQNICEDLQDEQCLSSDPDTICEPLCVTIEGVGGVPTPVAKLCDCIAGDKCGPIDVTPINNPPSDYRLSCEGLCDVGEICEVFIHGHATGLVSVNASEIGVGSLVCCDCAEDPPPPTCPLPPGDTLCKERRAIDCPEDQAGEFCQASCVDYNNDPVNPIVTASECGCGQEGDCHVVLDAAGQPTCAGTCADGTPCVPTTKDNDDGITLRFCCGCCPSNDLQVDLTTGVDDDTGGLIAIGLDDDTWTVTCEPVAGGTLPRPAKVIAKHPAWALIPGSQWVSATTGGLNGEYCYETCFCLDERARNPVLTLEILADDQATVFVNSFFLGQTPSPGFLVPTIMATTDETFLLPGETNCITVVVENQFGVVTGFNLLGSLTVENGGCCCGPTEDGSACEDVDCPVDTEKCQPQCAFIDPVSQEITVEGCECRGEDECHPVVVAGADPKCAGGCPDGEECIETLIHDDNGVVIGICCDCAPQLGACCDGTTGNCDEVPESECPVGCFGECVGGSYCDDPDCCVDPGNCPVCYAPNSQVSIELCGDCFGECINGGYCDSALPNCCIDLAACQCYAPSHPISIKLCGECFGECINGSYCESSLDPDCCVDPADCVCYEADHPISIKLCGNLPDPDNQHRWEKGLSCLELEPACEEHTGACCDGATGTCEDDVPESECPTTEIPPGIGTCANEEQCALPCPAIGACQTDSDCGPGGICLPGCTPSYCTCDANGVWNCTDDCNGQCAAVPNQTRWEKGTPCSELDPPCCGPCPTDVNHDGFTDAFDLANTLGCWSEEDPCEPLQGVCVCLDADRDGCIGAADLALVLGSWGACCRDGLCLEGESCDDCGPADSGFPNECTSERWCADGVDNDCDGATDCDDPDCDGDADCP